MCINSSKVTYMVTHIAVPVLYTLRGFATFFLLCWCAMWFFHLAAIIHGKCKLHKRCNPLSIETQYPGVSILKPLMGIDPNLYYNLETFFTMSYPLYEILFCIKDETDPVIILVKRLIEKYPDVDSKLFVGGLEVGVNPKINNMQPGYLAARHPLILVSDSGIRMKEDTLLDMVHHMSDDVGLVHQMPFVCDQQGFAAAVEKIFFGTVHARAYLAADLLRINCHTGMSALMRKTLLDQVGGIQAFGCYLAEDFFFAKSLTDRGWRTKVSQQPAWQNCGFCEITTFQARLQRWTKLRLAMLPHSILIEPLTECMVIGAFTSWAAYYLFHWDPLVFYLVHVLFWFLCDWILLSIVQNGSLPFNKFYFVIGWIFRELSAPYLFICAICNPAIKWRTQTYKLRWGGIAEEHKLQNIRT